MGKKTERTKCAIHKDKTCGLCLSDAIRQQSDYFNEQLRVVWNKITLLEKTKANKIWR